MKKTEKEAIEAVAEDWITVGHQSGNLSPQAFLGDVALGTDPKRRQRLKTYFQVVRSKAHRDLDRVLNLFEEDVKDYIRDRKMEEAG